MSELCNLFKVLFIILGGGGGGGVIVEKVTWCTFNMKLLRFTNDEWGKRSQKSEKLTDLTKKSAPVWFGGRFFL